MKEKAGITRRDFLKLSGAGMAGTLLSGIHLENIEAIGNGPNALEIEKKIPASQITILEYHYPGYEGAGITLPKELFEVQMDYLVSARYKTLTDKELAGFIQKGSFESVKSTVLRIDQGAAHFDEFEWMMGILKSKKLHPIVFISAGESFTDEQWKKLARWYKEGSISIGSHSVTHPNFKNITDEEAFGEAINSKKMIEKKLASVDAKIKIIGFSFPFDSVPENTNFLKRAGYSFGIGGVMERTENNAAKEGQFILPSTYPYMNTSQLDLNKQNNNVFMGAVPFLISEASTKEGSIDAVFKYARIVSSKAKINMGIFQGSSGVIVYDDKITGFAWGDNIGWNDLTAAISEVQLIPSNNPRATEARQEMGRWRGQVETIEDRPYLDRAEQIAIGEDVNSLQTAIAELSQIHLLDFSFI